MGCAARTGPAVNVLRALLLVKSISKGDLAADQREIDRLRVLGIARMPMTEPQPSAAEFMLYSRCALLAQDRPLARNILLRGAKDDPDDTEILLPGLTAMRLKEFPLARRWLKTVLAIEPKNEGAVAA